jgi:hypothetical protein
MYNPNIAGRGERGERRAEDEGDGRRCKQTYMQAHAGMQAGRGEEAVGKPSYHHVTMHVPSLSACRHPMP